MRPRARISPYSRGPERYTNDTEGIIYELENLEETIISAAKIIAETIESKNEQVKKEEH